MRVFLAPFLIVIASNFCGPPAAAGWKLDAALQRPQPQGAGLAPGAPAGGRPPSQTAAPSPYQVPYRLTETRHLLVRAKLNGKGPFHFILDSGAPALFVSTDVAKQLEVEPAGKHAQTQFERLEIEGGPVVERPKARVEDPMQLKGMNAMGLAGARLDGVFGYTILARFRIDIDLTRPTMAWTPLAWEPPAPAGLLELVGDQPFTPPPNVAAMERFTEGAGRTYTRKAEDEVVGRGFLGLELADRRGTVTVRAVVPAGPAAQAGLKAGDRILDLSFPGGKPASARSGAEVVRHAAKLAPGEEVRFTIQRGRLKRQVVLRASGASI